MVYTIGSPDWAPWDDYPKTLRTFWSKSYDGQYLPDFEEGFSAGEASLLSNDMSYFDALDLIEKSLRDKRWEAKIDGWRASTKKARGPTKYG